MALLAVGLLFKIGAVPFHAWTPDVYQGAPTPITAFMAAATKVAAFGALLRVFYVGLGGAKWDWHPMIWGVAIVTMVFGSLVAIVQTDVKRMLAYSSIAHAGLHPGRPRRHQRRGPVGDDVLPAGLRRSPRSPRSRSSRWSATAPARPRTCRSGPGWAGARRWSAGLFALLLLAFAGIPLTSGFTGKFAVFSAAVSAGATPLVVVGVLCQRGRRVLLHPGHRADVLLRPGSRRPAGRGALALTTALAVWIGRGGYGGPRRAAAAGPRPGRQARRS